MKPARKFNPKLRAFTFKKRHIKRLHTRSQQKIKLKKESMFKLSA